MRTPYLEGVVHGGVETLPNRSGKAKVDFDFWADFHVYGFLWTKDRLVWYVDGREVFSRENDFFHRPLHLTLDCEIMYAWTGEPDRDDLPAVYSIDYVRHWAEKPE